MQPLPQRPVSPSVISIEAEKIDAADGSAATDHSRDESRLSWHYYNAAQPDNSLSSSSNHIESFLSRVDFSSQAEDVRQPWFHTQASRAIAEALLEGRQPGAFLVRPSSQRSAYAISWVVSASQIRHDLVYALCPGYALSPKPNPENRFWSLSTLVAQCSFLREPVPNCDTDALVTRTLSQKGSEVVARIVERLRSNAPTLRELHWQLAILEGVVDIMADGAQTMVSTDRIEQRTFVRYCDEDYAAPCLIPLCDAPAARVFEALRTNTTLTTLNINGHKGFLRFNFTPNCTDKEAQLLAAALRENTTLQSLDLSVNAIGNEGATYLAQALRTNRTLKKLKLCHNMIQAPGLLHIAELMRVNTVLEEVEVSGQLGRKEGVVRLGGSDYERLLVSVVESTLKRRHELLDRSVLPCFCGFLTPSDATALVNRGQPGDFVFYLNPLIPHTVFVASKPLRGVPPKAHRTLYVTDAGYGTERDKRWDGPFPSLFEHCAWLICSSPPLLSHALATLTPELRERVQATVRLTPLWSIRPLPSPERTLHVASGQSFPALTGVLKWLALQRLRPMAVPHTSDGTTAERMQQYGFNP